jgi:flagellar FliL protein
MNKKKLLMIALPVLLLGGGAGAYFSGVLGGGTQKAPEAAALKPEAVEKKAVFYELPDIIVNLNSPGGRQGSLLKIKINLELESKTDIPKIEAVMPRIIDNLQVYIRELRAEDIQGSEGLYRLREELLHRVNVAVAPVKINEVLFSEIIMN